MPLSCVLPAGLPGLADLVLQLRELGVGLGEGVARHRDESSKKRW
jgi:hypothetical protein